MPAAAMGGGRRGFEISNLRFEISEVKGKWAHSVVTRLGCFRWRFAVEEFDAVFHQALFDLGYVIAVAGFDGAKDVDS